MNAEEIAKLLNTLVRYDLEETNRSFYYSDKNLVASTWGENLKAEEVAKVFGLKFEYDKGFSL